MSVSLPYLASNKNVEALFSSIQSAKIPDRFTQDFLSKTIGLKGGNDRAMIPLLRALGFIDQSGAPSPNYRQLKNREIARVAIANGVRKAYSALFEANEKADSLPAEKLKSLVAQVAGTDDDMTARIVSTFSALVRQGDFSERLDLDKSEENTGDEQLDSDRESRGVKGDKAVTGKGLNPQFHYNIQIHLPSNATEDVYLNIFNAIRKVFQ